MSLCQEDKNNGGYSCLFNMGFSKNKFYYKCSILSFVNEKIGRNEYTGIEFLPLFGALIQAVTSLVEKSASGHQMLRLAGLRNQIKTGEYDPDIISFIEDVSEALKEKKEGSILRSFI